MTIDANSTAIIVAVIAAIASLATTIISLINRGKLDVIHVLVNSNLTEIKRQLDEALSLKEAAELEVERLKASKP